MMTAYQLTRMW